MARNFKNGRWALTGESFLKIKDYFARIILFSIPCVSLFAPQLLTVLAVLLVAITCDIGKKNSFDVNIAFFSFTCFLGVGALSDGVFQEISKLFFMGCVAFFALSCRITAQQKKAFFLGMITLLGMLCMDIVLGQKLYKMLSRSLSKMYIQCGLFLSVMVWPFLSFVKKNKGVTFALFILCAFVIFFLKSDSAILAFTLGSLLGEGVYLTSLFLPSFTTYFFSITSGLLTFMAPFLFKVFLVDGKELSLFQNFSDISYLHRIAIWKEVTKKSFESPFIGHGIGSYRHIPDGVIEIFHEKNTFTGEKFGLHPHNLPLHVSYETGWIGIFFIAVVIGIIAYRMMLEREGRVRDLKLGCFISSMVIFWLSVGAYQTWWLSTLVLAVCLFQRESDYGEAGSLQN